MSATNRLALIIGIDAYEYEGFASLAFCKKDAVDLYETLLRLGYKIFKNEPLIGSSMDREFASLQIRKAIMNFFAEAESRQTLLFYFSGYGIPWSDDVYLSSPKVDPIRPMIEGFSFSDLTKLTKLTRSRQVLCIIDALYSGAADLPTPTEVKKNKVAEVNSSLARFFYDGILQNPLSGASTTYFLLSSQPYARSLPTSGNSLYTYYLIEGFRGGAADLNGNITPESLHQYISKRMAEVSTHLPLLKGEGTGQFILATYPPTKPKLEDLLKLLRAGKVAEFNMIRERDRSITINIQGAELQGVTLPGINLQRANLERANLESANLQGANLYMVTLRNARLKSIIMSGADLFEASLNGADLRRANLLGCRLQGADLGAAKLQSASLQGADLRFANFEGADLQGADLSNANLEGANLIDAVLTDASIGGAILRNSSLSISKDEAISRGVII